MIPLRIQVTLPSLVNAMSLNEEEESYLDLVQFTHEMQQKSIEREGNPVDEFNVHVNAWKIAHGLLVARTSEFSLTPPRQAAIRANYFLRQSNALEVYLTKGMGPEPPGEKEEDQMLGMSLADRRSMAESAFARYDGTMSSVGSMITSQPTEFWTS